MAVQDLSQSSAVLHAIAEFDKLGRSAFLALHGFGVSTKFFLVYESNCYDTKAIVGAAHAREFPGREPLRSGDFSGGRGPGQAAAVLERLGFNVVEKLDRNSIRELIEAEAASSAGKPGGGRTVHKAVLLRHLLAQLGPDGERLTSTVEIASGITDGLAAAMPDLSTTNPHQPIWRLDPSVFSLIDDTGSDPRPPGPPGDPHTKLLNSGACSGGLSAEVFTTLRDDPSLTGELLDYLDEVIAGRSPTSGYRASDGAVPDEKFAEGSGVRLRNLDGVELDAEFSVDQQGGATKLTIESRGGGRNRHYGPAFALAVDRLLNSGWTVVDALLASNLPRVRQATDAERRIFGPDDYPLSGSGSEITTALRNEAKHMFREPEARPGGGNTTRRIEVFFSHPDPHRIFQSDLQAEGAELPLPAWANEDVIVKMKIGDGAAEDPAARTAGLRRHAVAQNKLVKAYLDAGGHPFASEHNLDAAWTMPGSSTVFVAEVKGITKANEVGQLRLGLGQVIDFAVEVANSTGRQVHPILFVSVEPTALRWNEKCGLGGVELAWPDQLPAVLRKASGKKGRPVSEIFKDPRVVRMFDSAHRRPEFWEGGKPSE